MEIADGLEIRSTVTRYRVGQPHTPMFHRRGKVSTAISLKLRKGRVKRMQRRIESVVINTFDKSLIFVCGRAPISRSLSLEDI